MIQFLFGGLTASIIIVIIGFLDSKIFGNFMIDIEKAKISKWKTFAYISAFELALFLGGVIVGLIQ